MTVPDSRRDTISSVVNISALEAAGAKYLVGPNDAERAAIAKRLDIPAIRKLRGEFVLMPIRGGVDVVLKIDAETDRICVASLEPMNETIREQVRIQFDRNYVEDESGDLTENEIIREPLDGEEIDLGELLVQYLSLALDPYPRKNDVENLAEKFRDATSLSPFLSLKGLAGGE